MKDNMSNKNNIGGDILKRYNIDNLLEYLPDKEYLCLGCFCDGYSGKIMFVEDYCQNCLRKFRQPDSFDVSNLEYEAVRVEKINALSLNVGSDILKHFAIIFGWQKINISTEKERVLRIVKDAFVDIYEKLAKQEKEYIQKIYDVCLKSESLNKIMNYYVNLYNKTCESGDKNLKLIESISVKNLFGYHNYDFVMTKEALSIIIGTNGLGKTTIFQILKAILIKGDSLYSCYKKLEFILLIPFDEVSILFRDGTKILLKQEHVEGNEKRLLFSINNEKNIFFENDTNLRDLLKRKEKDKDDILLLHLFAEVETGLFYKATAVKDIYEIIEKKFPKIQSIKKRFLFIETKRISLTELKKEIAGKKPSRILKGIEKLSNCFSKLYYRDDPALKTICLSDKNKLVVKTSKNDIIDIENLSSGEKSALLILYEVIFHSETNAIILIDEPEISLHIAWQQQLGEMIQDLIKEKYGTQVIMATHSPFIAAGNTSILVEANLRGDDGE